MFRVAVGHSEDVLAREATCEVIDQVKASLAGAQPQAGILFCSIDYEHAVILSTIREAFPAIQLVGCTTDGELSSEMGFTEDSLILMVFASDTVEISAGAGREANCRGEEAGREAAETARAGLKRHAGEERLAVILAIR